MDVPFLLIDDPVRIVSEFDASRLIERIETVSGLIRKIGPDKAVDLAVMHHIPSVARLRARLASDDGKLALKQLGRGMDTVMAQHRRIYPHMMRVMFKTMADNHQSPDSDLAGRFATAVAELGLANYPTQPIKPFLLATLGNVEEGEYIRVVQDNAWNYATRRLSDLLRARADWPDVAGQFELARDSAAFTNWLLTPERVNPMYSQEILNAIELAGYEIEDPSVQREVVARAAVYELDLQLD